MRSDYDDADRVSHQFEKPPYDAWQGLKPWTRVQSYSPFDDVYTFVAYNEDERKMHKWVWHGAAIQLPNIQPAVVELHHKIIAALGRMPTENDVMTFTTRSEIVDGEVRVILEVTIKQRNGVSSERATD